MNTKKAVTMILMAFVVLSAGFLIYKELNKKEVATNTAVESAEVGRQTDVKESPTQVDAKPEGDRDQVADKTEAKAEVSVPAPLKRKTIAYYFFAKPRCTSCRKIEAFTDEAIRTGFEGELNTGALEWKLVDIKKKGNEHFIKDYQLYSKSVVIVNMENGEQVDWKNLQEVWNLLNDKQGFIDYVQKETRAFLEGNG